MNEQQNIRILKISFALIALLLLSVLLFFGTLTFCDALRGFEIWKQYANGANWNTLNYPDVEHPIYSYYVAWWSPAQWMIPAFFKTIFQLSSIQIIQSLTIIFCLILSLIGFKQLFEKLGFKPHIVWLSLLCIITNQVFYWHTLMYYGGDLLLLCFFPYFILGILKISAKLSLKNSLLFVLIVLVGLFLKNTYLVIAACSLSFLFFAYQTSSLMARIKHILPFSFIFVLIYILMNHFHLSLGETPGTAHDFEGFSDIKKDLIGDLTYSFGSPFGTFSRYSLILQKLNLMLQIRFSWINMLQILPFLLTFVFLYKNYQKGNPYYNLLVFLALPFFALFTFFNLQNKAVGYEMRHFAPIVFLFFPGIITWMLSSSKKILMSGLIASFCLLDLGLYALSVKKIEQTHSFWKTYKLPNEDVELFNFISNWEKKHPSGLLIVEEYWQLAYAAFNKDKIVLKKKGKELLVVSGMELEFPDVLKSPVMIYKNHTEALIILQKNGKLDLEHDLNLNSCRLLKSTSNYKLYLSKLN